jgi:hypothetical protein
MSELYGVKVFKFKGKIATSDFNEKFGFRDDDYVMFFRSHILDPSKLISPRGNLRDIIIGVVRKQSNGRITHLLTGSDYDNLDLVKNVLEKGEECEDKELVVDECFLKEDPELTNMIAAPVYTFIEKGEKFILRTLDVIRYQTPEDESETD